MAATLPETTSDAAEPVFNGEVEEYIACYPYESAEIGDLIFSVGERILVIKKDGDWWTGMIGNRTGIFPSNYVQTASAAGDTNTTTDYTSDTSQNGPQQYTGGNNSELAMATSAIAHAMDDEAKTQEEADTEVSEINTQPKSEQIQETYSRPMSTSTTPVNILIHG